MLTKQELDRYLFERGWIPVQTDLPEFHNYRKVSIFGNSNYCIVSICLQPDIINEYDTAAKLYHDLLKSAGAAT